MIILVTDIDDIRTCEGERDAPASAYTHGPGSSPLALEWVEVQPRQAHVPWLFRDVQSTQDHAESSGVFGLEAGGRSTEEEAFQALVPESQDRHGRIVTRNVSGYNRLTAGCSGPARPSAPTFVRHPGTLSPV